MHNLPSNIQDLLQKQYCIKHIEINKKEKSKDGTIKYIMKLYDNTFIESVLIPSKKRLTACISSQIGCSLNCKFCATGKLKLKRNLSFAEIYDQVFILKQEGLVEFNQSITNIVFMGMGEPLLNYTATMKSIELITDKKGLAISPKRITISTVGIAKAIFRLADEKIKCNLAISLHSPFEEKRSSLIPINNSIGLIELKNAVRYYYEKTQNRITYEYILFKNINDGIEDAIALAKFCKTSPCKINLIIYNKIKGGTYKGSTNQKIKKFILYLDSKNLIVTLRKSKGEDINAACGQLIATSQ